MGCSQCSLEATPWHKYPEQELNEVEYYSRKLVQSADQCRGGSMLYVLGDLVWPSDVHDEINETLPRARNHYTPRCVGGAIQ